MAGKNNPMNAARLLAELLDSALAGEWQPGEPVLAVLREKESDGDELDLAMKRIEHGIEEELEAFEDDPGCLAVAHSEVPRSARKGSPAGEPPPRITVGVDRHTHAGLVRHPDGLLRRRRDVDLPLVTRLRAALPALQPPAGAGDPAPPQASRGKAHLRLVG